jgi:chorismate synthase
MKNTFGDLVSVTLFGESHGPAVGAVLDGMAPGVPVDSEAIARALSLRRPWGEFSTARREEDEYQILSGVFRGVTTGSPIAVVIPNRDTKSADYDELASLARPGHADYTAYVKYGGFADRRGGGHFSGRVTAALCAVGAIAASALREKGIRIGTHIAECAGIKDLPFPDDPGREIDLLAERRFPVLSEERGEEMKARILAAKEDGDSVGGILETVVTGMPAGVGEPFFDSTESKLAHALLSIGGVKGVSFGAGFAFASMRGSKANDPFFCDSGRIVTKTNHNGGVNGGMTNGMPVLFRIAVQPTPSISLPQRTVNFRTMEETEITVSGRHDPAIIHRARIAADCAAALAVADLLALRCGTDWLAE